MNQLDLPTAHQLSAAIGWLELGNSREAFQELARITPEFRNAPQVLELSWMLHSCEADWEPALSVARQLMAVAPENPESWLHHAYSIRRAPGGTLEAAWNALAPALDKFPNESTIPYNLACYACQMGRLDDARNLLQRASAAGSKKMISQMALADRDLEPLWAEIRSW